MVYGDPASPETYERHTDSIKKATTNDTYPRDDTKSSKDKSKDQKLQIPKGKTTHARTKPNSTQTVHTFYLNGTCWHRERGINYSFSHPKPYQNNKKSNQQRQNQQKHSETAKHGPASK